MVHVTQPLVLCICFVDHCLSFCTFSFDHCVVCSSLIYKFWLPLWYLQTLPLFVQYSKSHTRHTVMGQTSLRTNILPYIFHIKPWFILILVKSCLTRFNENFIIKSRNRYSFFMTYHWVCNKSNKMGVTSWAGTADPSRAPEFTPWFLVGFMLLDL